MNFHEWRHKQLTRGFQVNPNSFQLLIVCFIFFVAFSQSQQKLFFLFVDLINYCRTILLLFHTPLLYLQQYSRPLFTGPSYCSAPHHFLSPGIDLSWVKLIGNTLSIQHKSIGVRIEIAFLNWPMTILSSVNDVFRSPYCMVISQLNNPSDRSQGVISIIIH